MGCRPRRRRLQAADRPRSRRKSGGFRTIILFRVGGHSFFVHGFAKNETANVTPKELKALKKLAAVFLGFDAEALAKASAAGEIAEVRNDGEDGEQN